MHVNVLSERFIVTLRTFPLVVIIEKGQSYTIISEVHIFSSGSQPHDTSDLQPANEHMAQIEQTRRMCKRPFSKSCRVMKTSFQRGRNAEGWWEAVTGPQHCNHTKLPSPVWLHTLIWVHSYTHAVSCFTALPNNFHLMTFALFLIVFIASHNPH